MSARVLIVDDEADITNVLSRALKIAGYQIDVKNNPLDALASFKAGVYRLVIIDLKMPEMNGFDLYEKMAKVDPNVRVCFLTAFDAEYFERFKKRFPHVSSKCFIRKPIALKDFVQMVNNELYK